MPKRRSRTKSLAAALSASVSILALTLLSEPRRNKRGRDRQGASDKEDSPRDKKDENDADQADDKRKIEEKRCFNCD